jgi:hypothetical protein
MPLIGLVLKGTATVIHRKYNIHAIARGCAFDGAPHAIRKRSAPHRRCRAILAPAID